MLSRSWQAFAASFEIDSHLTFHRGGLTVTLGQVPLPILAVSGYAKTNLLILSKSQTVINFEINYDHRKVRKQKGPKLLKSRMQ